MEVSVSAMRFELLRRAVCEALDEFDRGKVVPVADAFADVDDELFAFGMQVQPLDEHLVTRIQSLVGGIEVDLDQRLGVDDE